jgi:hypothetical protein
MNAIADDFATIAAGVRRLAAPAEDPVIALYRRYLEVETAGDVVYARHKILRAALIERNGDPGKLQCSAKSIWGHDPSYAEFCASFDETDRLGAVSTDLIQQMMKTPAATLAGLLAKLTVGMNLWAPAKPADDTDFDEEAARAFMADAVRLLGESLP